MIEDRIGKMFMLDYSRGNLWKASARLKKTVLVRSTLDPLPFEDNVFDFVVLVRVMHHVPDAASLLSEVVRVSRNGGVFVLGIVNELLRRRPKERVLLRVEPGRQRIYSTPLQLFGHPNLVREEIRGVGIFDNRIGRRLERLYPLAGVDVKTSRFWPAKPMLFIKYRVSKKSRGMNEPHARCTCGGLIEGTQCNACGRTYGEIVDLVER